MPLQNRVTPSGTLEAVTARGTMMGIRGGGFHRADKTLKPRHWASRQWICCVLSFKGRRRQVFSPGRLTELFFLDEATAFAAGHRPCFECRRADATRFASLWSEAHGLASPPRAPEMDLVLHGERCASAPEFGRGKRRLRDIPDGAFVEAGDSSALVSGGAIYPWTHHGYREPTVSAPTAEFALITPPSIIGVLAAGYRAAIHSSAMR